MRKSRDPDELAATHVRVAALPAVFFAGNAVQSTKNWPYPVLRDSADALADIACNAKTHAGIAPVRRVTRRHV